MSPPIEVDAGKVNFRLQNLQGCIPFNQFIDFLKPHPLERLSLLKDCDPNRSRDDLLKLQEIHQTIKKLLVHGTEAEKISAQYWLTSLFLVYFKTYRLDREDSPCRRSWVHLLKLRCHSLIALHTIKKSCNDEDLPEEKDILKQLPMALREWRTFCQNPQNHFWFKKEHELDSPEEEMWKILHGEDERRKKPHSYFLVHPEGRKVLRRRFVSDWLLNDRYDWCGAFRLCCHYWKGARKLRLVIFSVLLIMAWLFPIVEGYFQFIGLGYFQAFQVSLFLSVIMMGLVAFGSESFIELLVPRLWAAVAVGYVPALVTGEIWEASMGIPWNGLWAFCGVSFLLSWLYLRWEIGNRMRQTANLNVWVPVRRALILLIIGVIISLLLGVLILDFIGELLAGVYLNSENSRVLLSKEYYFQGLVGKVYLKILLSFSSIALLLGVVLQIFWHEKPVTAPV